jgi:hypothetical protein
MREVVKGCITRVGARVSIRPGATTMRSTVPITDQRMAITSSASTT